MNYVVAADISASGKEILIKTYTNIFYWKRNQADSLWKTLSSVPDTLPYFPEPQGEAVCWAGDESGYYTLSERPFGLPTYLYFYPRLNSSGTNLDRKDIDPFHLQQNYPNPFNHSTTINFSLRKQGNTELFVYNELGKIVKSLVNEEKAAGEHSTTWDGKDLSGNVVSSGMYYYSIKDEDDQLQFKKMLFLK